MTNQEILEGNKLIAEFMQYSDIDCHECKHSGVCNHLQCGLSTQEKIEQFKFNSSWDWLMEVIDKIESLEGSNPFKNNPKVKFQGDHVEIFWYSTYRGDCIYWKNYTGIDNNTYQHKNQEDSRILAAFRAIIEFIKWYNKKK